MTALPELRAPVGHTPGPWIVAGQMHDNNRVIRAGDKSGNVVAFAADFNRYDRDAEADANAALIAAAPDLLEALETYDDFVFTKKQMTSAEFDSELRELHEYAQAIIARAKGGAA